MHELSIVENIVSTTLQFTKEHQIDRVSFLTIQVGKLTGVEPPYLHMYYGDLTKDTALVSCVNYENVVKRLGMR